MQKASGQVRYIINEQTGQQIPFQNTTVFQWLQMTNVPGVRVQKLRCFDYVSDGIADLLDPLQLNPVLSRVDGKFAFNYVLTIPGGYLLDQYGMVFTPDGYFLQDLRMPGSEDQEITTVNAHTVSARFETLPGVVATIGAEATGNFFHTIYDIFPRIQLLDSAQIQYDTLMYSPSDHPFIDEVREMAPCDMNKYKLLEDGIFYQAEKLVVPSFIGWCYLFYGVDLEPSVLEWSTEMICPGFQRRPYPENGDRFYFSRRQYESRHILNEDEIMEVLTAYGFQRIEMENYPIREQVKMVQNAQVILGPHGSGLSHCHFAPIDSHLVEIGVHRHRVHHNFKPFARLTQTRHHFLEALPVGPGSAWSHDILRNMLLEPQKLQALLQTILP